MLDRSKIHESFMDLAVDLDKLQIESNKIIESYTSEINNLILEIVKKADIFKTGDFDIDNLTKEIDQLFSNAMEFINEVNGKIDDTFEELEFMSEKRSVVSRGMDYYKVPE